MLSKYLRESFENYEEDEKNDKDDIWIHQKIEYKKNTVSKSMIDTVITNIFCDENLKNIRKMVKNLSLWQVQLVFGIN